MYVILGTIHLSYEACDWMELVAYCTWQENCTGCSIECDEFESLLWKQIMKKMDKFGIFINSKSFDLHSKHVDHTYVHPH